MPRGKKKENKTVDIYETPPLPARIEGEDELDYQVLCSYCLLGVKRSLTKAAELYYKNVPVENETQKNAKIRNTINRIKNISNKDNWVSRAREYDVLCQRFYQQHLINNLRSHWEDWVQRGLEMDLAQTKLLREVCSQIDEYCEISEARKKWIAENRSRLSKEPKVLSLAVSLEKEGLDFAEKVLKVSDQLYDKQTITQLVQAQQSQLIAHDFVNGDQAIEKSLEVEELKKERV